MTALPRLGFIGLGRMGAPMCQRLIEAEYHVVAFDVRPEPIAVATAHGAQTATSPAEVTRQVDIVITIVPDPPAVESVVYGETGVMSALTDGKILLEMTTSSPLLTRRISADVDAAGARMLDAPVSGGVRGAESGKLAVMVGGGGSPGRMPTDLRNRWQLHRSRGVAAR